MSTATLHEKVSRMKDRKKGKSFMQKEFSES